MNKVYSVLLFTLMGLNTASGIDVDCKYSNNKKFTLSVSAIQFGVSFDDYYHKQNEYVFIETDNRIPKKVFSCSLTGVDMNYKCKFKNGKLRAEPIDLLEFGNYNQLMSHLDGYDYWEELRTFLKVDGSGVSSLLNGVKDANCSIDLK
jgi:hypothetical protein